LSRLLLKSDEPYFEDIPVRLGKMYDSRISSVFKLYGGMKIVDDSYIEMALQIPGSFCP
jgi:hypothetical protein